VDAYGHQLSHGGSGQYSASTHGRGLRLSGGASSLYDGIKGIKVLDDDGNLVPEARQVLDLIAEANIILSVGHLTLQEIRVVVSYGKEIGMNKLILDHPHSSTMRIDIENQIELADLGCIVNHTYAQVSPRFHAISVGQLADNIRRLGPRRVVLSSDAGQIGNPTPAESMRIYVQLLLEEGISPDDIRVMLHENPGRMLYD
jgi:hypothetical protein